MTTTIYVTINVFESVKICHGLWYIAHSDNEVVMEIILHPLLGYSSRFSFAHLESTTLINQDKTHCCTNWAIKRHEKDPRVWMTLCHEFESHSAQYTYFSLDCKSHEMLLLECSWYKNSCWMGILF